MFLESGISPDQRFPRFPWPIPRVCRGGRSIGPSQRSKAPKGWVVPGGTPGVTFGTSRGFTGPAPPGFPQPIPRARTRCTPPTRTTRSCSTCPPCCPTRPTTASRYRPGTLGVCPQRARQPEGWGIPGAEGSQELGGPKDWRILEIRESQGLGGPRSWGIPRPQGSQRLIERSQGLKPPMN